MQVEIEAIEALEVLNVIYKKKGLDKCSLEPCTSTGLTQYSVGQSDPNKINV